MIIVIIVVCSMKHIMCISSFVLIGWSYIAICVTIVMYGLGLFIFTRTIYIVYYNINPRRRACAVRGTVVGRANSCLSVTTLAKASLGSTQGMYSIGIGFSPCLTRGFSKKTSVQKLWCEKANMLMSIARFYIKMKARTALV